MLSIIANFSSITRNTVIVACAYNKRSQNVQQIIYCTRKTPLFIRNNDMTSCSGQNKGRVVFKPYVKPCYEDHDHKNMRLKRPMSPHLTIYAPTLPAMTSISQRITGVILTFYAFSLSSATLFLSDGINSYVSIIQSLNLSSFFIFILKLLIGIPFAYHYCNGIRYIGFNAGKWLNKKDVYSTAKTSVIGAAVIVVLFALR